MNCAVRCIMMLCICVLYNHDILIALFFNDRFYVSFYYFFNNILIFEKNVVRIMFCYEIIYHCMCLCNINI